MASLVWVRLSVARAWSWRGFWFMIPWYADGLVNVLTFAPWMSNSMGMVSRLSSSLVFTHFAYASYFPYLYDRTVSTVYRTHFGLCRYWVVQAQTRSRSEERRVG